MVILMELNEKQKLGLNIAVDRYKNNEKYTVIARICRYWKINIGKIYNFCFTKY